MCKPDSFLASTFKCYGAKRRGLRLAPLFLLLGGCASLEQIAPVVSTGAGASAGALYLGRKIYTQQCTACHAAEPVTAYTAAEWARILPYMAHRTKLQPDQAEAVRAYVAAVLQRPATPGR